MLSLSKHEGGAARRSPLALRANWVSARPTVG